MTDFNKRIRLEIAYDGTVYGGYQMQQNANTVQNEMQNAIQKVFGERLNLTGCSRTDSGVHARQFFCHFDLNRDMPVAKIPKALNFYLPFDIVAISAFEVAADFHSRYDSKAKTYCYRILNRDSRSPFDDKYTYHCIGNIDIEKMNKAAVNILGEQDFACFMSAGSKISAENSPTVRNITQLNVTRSQDIIAIEITANGFLYNMVRIIAGTLLQCGKGEISPEYIKTIIASKSRALAGSTLPAKGLTLERIYY